MPQSIVNGLSVSLFPSILVNAIYLIPQQKSLKFCTNIHLNSKINFRQSKAQVQCDLTLVPCPSPLKGNCLKCDTNFHIDPQLI